jgi:filamentous hemagglutinin family protein
MNSHRLRQLTYTLTSAILLAQFGTRSVQAQSIAPAIDGTGTKVDNVTPDRFNITGGTQSGANLFHSFQQFGLNRGESANFITAPNTANVLSRVTGGGASYLNGQIQVSGSQANLFLLNPAGIAFGKDVSLNIPASFTATTANAIGFGNNQWWSASGANNVANFSTAPSSLAFTNAQSGGVVNTGNLTVNPHQSVTLAGGTVVNTGTITAPGGHISLVAVPGEKIVRLSHSDSLLSLDLPTDAKAAINPQPFTALSIPALVTGGEVPTANGVTVENGIVKLTNTPGSNVVAGNLSVASSDRGGKIDITGTQVAVLNANLDLNGANGGGTARIGGDYQGTGNLPRATQTTVDSNSKISANGTQSGAGGRVIVWADGNTRMNGEVTATGIAQGGLIETSGKQTLDVTGARVSASASNGVAGTWLLDPTDINIVNGGTGTPTSGTFNPPSSSSIAPTTIASTMNAGTNVVISTAGGTGGSGDITLTNGISQTTANGTSLTLTGRRFINNAGNNSINLASTGGLTFNLNQVNPETNPNTASIQAAQNAIGNVGGTRSINLGNGTYAGSTLNITKNVTIAGNGATNTILDGQSTRRVIYVGSGNLTLNNVRVINGRLPGFTPNGGIDGERGGGIYVAPNAGLNVNNSTFTGNSALYGGGIYALEANMSISGATFTGNNATFFGGGFSNGSGTTTATNTIVNNNTSGDNGGGISNSGTLTLTDSQINNNTAPTLGGGIYTTGNLTLNNTQVNNNTNNTYGGGIYNGGTVNVNNTSNVNGNSSARGGGIYNNEFGTTNISNSNVDSNVATQVGGGIYNLTNRPLTITNSNIRNNGRNSSGTIVTEFGGGILNDGTLNISGSTITGNAVTVAGGGIFNQSSGTMTINNNSNISSNNAVFGGGIYNNSNNNNTITGGTLNTNNARQGGAIKNVATLELTNVSLTNNTGIFGGAIFNDPNSPLTLTGSNFTNNGVNSAGTVIGEFGGGLFNLGTTTINNSNFSGNATAVAGGGIFSEGNSTIAINNSTITNNQSSFGGGIYNTGNTGTNITVNNSTVSNNTARRIGGGIFTSDNATTNVNRSTISNNGKNLQGTIITPYGGGLFTVGRLNINTSTISGNESLELGGGIYNQTGGILDIRNSTIANNNTLGQGGGIFTVSTATLFSSIVANNTAASGPNIHGAIASTSTFNLIGNGSQLTGITNGVGNNQIGITPAQLNLGALANNGGATQTQALGAGSAAINTGSGTTTDQRGIAPTGQRDVGAFEAP